LEASHPAERQDRKEPRRGRVLAARVLVGVIFVPVILLIANVGGIVFALFVTAIAAFGSYEFFRMFARRGRNPSMPVGVAGSICICLSFHLGAGQWAPLVMTGFVLVVLIERLVRQDRDAYLTNVGTTVLGMVYVGWLLGYFIALRNAENSPAFGSGGGGSVGRDLVFLVLAVTWSYDTLAYIAGTFLGRHRFFSRISPSKTIEGTLVGLGGAVAAALISSVTFISFLSIRQGVVLGLLLGVFAQAGDLVESIMKRSTGTKDSSHMIPGHGGVLDRFDSLIFTGPAAYLFLRMAAAWSQL
jgi:phosphatidate cytidylyltransferase